MLAQFSHECPGLHGKGSKTDIHEETIGQVLQSHSVVEIPIMQRRYCWSGTVLHKWWADIVGEGVRRNWTKSGTHRAGKAVFRVRDDGSSLLVVDGQQRLTTTALLLMAVTAEIMANYASTSIDDKAQTIVDKVDQFLFRTSPSKSPTTSRLIPSFLDREAYFSLLMNQVPSPDPSALVDAYNVFRTKTYGLTLDRLDQIATSAVHGVTIMRVNILTENLNLCQVFQWLQERSLVAGEILFNPTPGINFGSIDLIRNLFVSNYIHWSRDRLESLYETRWLPFELLFSSNGLTFDQFLNDYISSKESEAPNDKTGRQKRGIKLYSSFTALYSRIVDPAQVETMDSISDVPDKISPMQMLLDMHEFAKTCSYIPQNLA
ncbi:hypothetical protein BCR33DRAFT_716263 [Rhizoclosmatium globosum]|uniref:GmrSD restriction endonucleases N-terminal domain-containing protein n=1 Tax=Rhizoclosmatium globosum TaxID=329046 RepID=A0A1Y2CEX5_9FUNG|nr:hypothetical protein BCR33DRAFT_716263 [Rhizoclosmatium globosum]|eukprot:ORY45611.1 hypothetical protein BCR33DRAFT_716263 [Rhizoclosmatium globosum]